MKPVFNDAFRHVTSGKRHWSDPAGAGPVAGQQFEYAFDDIGNRTSTGSGGDASGANLRTASYSANNLNQYTSRDVPGYLDIQGEAATNATVTVWNSDGTYATTYRKGTFYRGELPVTNSMEALWLTITNLAVMNGIPPSGTDIITNSVGNAFVPKTPEAFTYDADGNLTSDGRWTNTWDGENRLVAMESLGNTPDESRRKLLFTYDNRGRRTRKQSYAWDSGSSSWVLTTDLIFLYDGWNLVAELNPSSGAVVRSYLWGTDLSGSMQGAGGVGGLIEMNDVAGDSGFHFAAFDGNGNVTALAEASDGTESAFYEYGPFGEPTRVSGAMAASNPIRFSTKYQDGEDGPLYFIRRYLLPSSGRWMSCDPSGLRGGVNLVVFVRNNPVKFYDPLGLAESCSEYVRKDGTPFIFFDPPQTEGGGWKVNRYEFTAENNLGDADGITEFTGVLISWEAAVEVYCKCPKSCFESRKGTRSLAVTIPYSFFGYEMGGGGIDIPSPASFVEAIGEVAARAIDSTLKKPYALSRRDVMEIGRRASSVHPTKPTDGAWKGGKSPCI